MNATDRAARIAEVRQRLAEIDAHANPAKLGGGWTVLHLRALLEQVDEDQRLIDDLVHGV